MCVECVCVNGAPRRLIYGLPLAKTCALASLSLSFVIVIVVIVTVAAAAAAVASL